VRNVDDATYLACLRFYQRFALMMDDRDPEGWLSCFDGAAIVLV
jgi:3-phenylpropionate/cinnamic acid dioxygenase small subunit